MKHFTSVFFIVFLVLILFTGCSTVETDVEETEEKATDTGIYNTVNLAEDYDNLLNKVKSNLITGTYHSGQYNLDIPYGLYIPKEYDENKEYPLVMFIPDSSLAGKDINAILEQGYGGVVWADEKVQTGNPAFILYPDYPDVTVDDHNGYTITDYVPATVGLIEQIQTDYSIDDKRVYATGQSMGCMTSLVLACQNPDLFTACMFVDGQWDPTSLAPLANQTFCYFAAQDDTSAYNGMQSTIPVWEENGAKIVQETWKGNWSHDEIQDAAQKMIEQDSKIYCIVWETGTIEPKQMGGSGQSMGGPSGDSGGGILGPNGDSPQSGGAAMNSVGYHMASFDYAYKVNTMVGWTLFQEK